MSKLSPSYLKVVHKLFQSCRKYFKRVEMTKENEKETKEAKKQRVGSFADVDG